MALSLSIKILHAPRHFRKEGGKGHGSISPCPYNWLDSLVTWQDLPVLRFISFSSTYFEQKKNPSIV
jgi:hypothetical protein